VPNGPLTRALAIIHHVAEHGPQTIQRISTDIGIPLATTYRYVTDLIDVGYLFKRSRYAPCELGPAATALVDQVRHRVHADRLATVAETLAARAPSAPGPWLALVAEEVVDALDGQQDRDPVKNGRPVLAAVDGGRP
jgi:hypothetical protein